MAWWNRKLKRKLADLEVQLQGIQASTTKLSDLTQWAELFGGSATWAGPVVSADTALKISAVWGCVRLIASSVSSSPAEIFQNLLKDDKEIAQVILNHKYRSLLQNRPNPFITASTFWKFIINHKLISGNAYALIFRKGSEIEYLLPIKPSRVQPCQAWEIGLDKKLGVEKHRLYYQVTLDHGEFKLIDQDDMLHFPNLGWDGKRGLSTISHAAQSFGLAMAEEEYGARFFGQGASFQYAISYPAKLGDAAIDRLRNNLIERQHGMSNVALPLVLTEGGDIKPFSMSARDGQVIESRQFSVIDICRWFGVPPVMNYEMEKTTSFGQGIEQMARWFVMFTLNDHFTDIEQELNTKLFRNDGHFIKFDESELTRGDTQTRYNAYKIALGGTQNPGFMSPNEARKLEGLPPDNDPASNKIYRFKEGANVQPKVPPGGGSHD